MSTLSQPERRELKAVSLPPLVLDRNEAATALRISIRKLDDLIGRGDITATRIDGRVLVAWTELQRFVASRSAEREEKIQLTV